MPEKAYDAFFFLKNRKYQISILLSSVLCLISLIIIEHTVGNRDFFFNGLVVVKFSVYLQLIPIMLLTTLSGNLAASVVLLFFFFIEFFLGSFFPYHIFVLLIGSLVAEIPVSKGWYKNLIKSLLMSLFIGLLLGNGWNILLSVLEDRIYVFENEFSHFFCGFFPSLIVVLLSYCFYNYCPERIRNLFFNSLYDSEFFLYLNTFFKRKNKGRIKDKLTFFIVSISLLIFLLTFIFANTLLGDFRNVTDWQQIVFATRLIILIVIVSTPIIISLFSYTNISISYPIQILAKAVEDGNVFLITERTRDLPRLDIRKMNIDSNDETGVLYKVLLDMLTTTESYIKNLERSQLLETQLASAKAASKAKSDFLSNMSHEIRTPINAVLGLNEMIIRECHEEEIAKYAKAVENAGKSLLSIVNDILDFSKIEAGKLEIIPIKYDLSSSINDLINMISKRARDKNLDFIVNVSPETPYLLYGDDVRIKQCITNILTNAVKYTSEGSITLSISSKKSDYSHTMLTVHVIDTGIGIKDKDIPKLFTAFQRIEEERNRTIEGTGLGLNIVQSLLSLMNSRLEVVSVYGEGSDFYFSVLQGVIDWDPIGDFKETYKKTQSNSREYHELFIAPKARVLVVDDTELNLTVVKGLLKQTKITVDTVISGYDAIEAVQKNHYDIIFLDHRMPGMDGIQTFEKLFSLKNNLSKGVPIVALTANAVSGAKEMYLSVGFSDYMTKPIEGKKLEALILKYLPKELIEAYEPPASEDLSDLDENGEIKSEEKNKRNEILYKLTGINIEDALKFTGGEEVFEQAAKEFYRNIEKKASEIEKFFKNKDWENYTVWVHALKSSSRLIGAEKLSEDAKYLEKCGDDKNESEITEKTPALLELYRSYKEHFAPLCEENESDAEKEEMSLEKYKEALSNIGECVQTYDYDTADQIIAMMKDFKIPAEKKEHFNELCDAVSAVDHDRILKIVIE